jgi:4-hydroxy-2-oxoheptanedioate aldolase
MPPDAPVPLRRRLSGPGQLLGTFSIIPSVEIVEMSAIAGFDLVILDMEHGAFDFAQLGSLILAARAWGAVPVARVRSNEPSLISAVLDAGAAGVVVPQVSSRAAAEAAVRAARFPPEGGRGANPWVRSAAYTSGGDYYRQANSDVAVMVMVEGAEGVAAVDEIVATPGLDAVFLGPVDLSNALGVPGEPEHPTVVDAVEHVIARAGRHGVAVAVFAPSPAAARRWLELGVTLVALGEDTLHILAALESLVAAVRGGDERGGPPA